jgi:hypothetical protein
MNSKSLIPVGIALNLMLPINTFALGIPTMNEVTQTSGIEHQYTGGWEFFVGGGVTAFDCNGDFKPELFIAGGESESALYLNETNIGGSARFKKLAQLALPRVTGAYALNLNDDSFTDLVVLRHGDNHVYLGGDDCKFTLANESLGIPSGDLIDEGNKWTTAFAATWEEGQRQPTLVFGNYIDQTKPGAPFGTCATHQLYRPAQSSSEQTYATANSLKGYCSLSMLFTDWNRDGTADLRSANDRQYYRDGHEQLWDFSGEPTEYTENEGWARIKLWGMGIAHQDVNADGLSEYFVTSMADNKLSSLVPRANGPVFEDLAFDKGVTAHRPFIGDSVMPSTAWHAQFEDVNNDTYSDLFVVKGNVEAMTDFAQEDPNNLLLGHADGTFVESAVDSNFVSVHRGRGGSLVDLNLDGLLDAVVVNRMENTQIWMNTGFSKTETAAPMGNWLNVLLKQPKPNVTAVGAWVEVRVADRTLTKEITIGGGHGGNTNSFHHFGIGVAERATVRVQWPDGSWSAWVRVFANQFVQLEKGSSTANVWLPE